MINVVIVDDHLMVVEGLKTSLKQHPSIYVSATFQKGAELTRYLRHAPLPDVVLLDLQLLDTNGNELVPQLLEHYPQLKILIFSSLETMAHIKDMMKNGCRGYLFKTTTDKDTLLEAITTVHEGSTYLDPATKEQLFQDMLTGGRTKDKLNPKLSLREKEVLALISTENTSQQIADALFISLKTVETHRYNLMQKLEVKNAAGLCRKASLLGLIE